MRKHGLAGWGPVAVKHVVWVWTFSIILDADKDGAGLPSSYTGISDPEEPCRSVWPLSFLSFSLISRGATSCKMDPNVTALSDAHDGSTPDGGKQWGGRP